MLEVLSPAGNLENLINAVNAGANAVYLGLNDFSARKSAQNFTIEELEYAVNYAKLFNAKIYVALNTLVKNSELENFFKTLNNAYNLGVDAFILQDIFLGKKIKEKYPFLTLHLSTQAGVCNTYGAKLAKRYGFSRVILARETKIEDVKEISKIIETEVFVHGALCTSFSGHCYFSSFIGGMSGNRGYCKQPCRKKYSSYIDNKKVSEGYLLSLSDLCSENTINEYIKAGVSSFKIEGRMRSSEYIVSTVKYYSKLILGENDLELKNDILKSFNRGDFTSGLPFGQQKGFISNKIQNHKGLSVGKIKSVHNGIIILENNVKFNENDSFKIINSGYEVGNAIYKNGKILYKGNAKRGDILSITKEVNLLENISSKRFFDIVVTVNAKLNEKLSLSSNGITVCSDNVLEFAKTSKTTKNDVILNLNKVDKYPFNIKVNFNNFDENLFIVKSVLNNLRSELYYKIFNRKILKNNEFIAKYTTSYIDNFSKVNACIVDNLSFNFNKFTDIVYMPKDYKNIDKINYFSNKRIWLYVPPYVSENGILNIKELIKNNSFYGIYSDSVFAIELKNELNVPLFAGVGFNIFNDINLNVLNEENITFACLSKELSLSEVNKFPKNLCKLSSGQIEIMDLIYCPFEKNCNNCKLKYNYTLKDENNRSFEILRYLLDGCKFKVFNTSLLINEQKDNSKIHDLRLLDDNFIKILSKSVDIQKETIKNYTNGNYNKGVL